MSLTLPLSARLTAASSSQTSGATLESAAIAAAAAAVGRLFYAKGDLSNVYTDSGVTRATALAQAIGQINDVLGGSGYFRQTTAGNRPLLSACARGYAMTFDGTDDFMSEDSQYFTAAETPAGNTYVIAGVISNASAAARVIYHNGTANANPRFPYLALNASDVALASWRGDDTTTRSVTGTTTGDAVPLVITASKNGNNKRVYVNGVSEGTPDGNAMGSLASVSRSRLGIANDTTNPFPGQIALLFESKTLTDAQRVDIERFTAYLIGATYLG